jgi:peptidyl-prolyl cis-trans isomerase SurA
MASYAFNMKKNEAVNDWFVKTKEELYISIDEEYNECDILSNKVP